METIKALDTATLQNWLENGRPVSILDIRPIQERMEWFIPDSIYLNAYEKLKAGKPDALKGLHLDKTIPIVTVCAGGKTSLIAAELLNKQGFEAYSLKDGMKGWSLSWNKAMHAFKDFRIIQLRRTGKGCLSYIVASNGEAAVIDASLPIDIYEEVLNTEKLILKYVIETHLHADHLSRSKQLADNHNTTLLLPVPNTVKFHFTPVKDDSAFQIGNISLKAIHTPGHTLESTSYLIDDKVLLTGDTLFINGVGRPDLKASNEEATQKSKMLYNSLQKLLALNENILVMPAHTSQPIEFDRIPIQATFGDIKKTIAILKLNEDEFINSVLGKIPPIPANYLSIIEKNTKGDFSDISAVDLEAGANRCAVS